MSIFIFKYIDAQKIINIHINLLLRYLVLHNFIINLIKVIQFIFLNFNFCKNRYFLNYYYKFKNKFQKKSNF